MTFNVNFCIFYFYFFFQDCCRIISVTTDCAEVSLPFIKKQLGASIISPVSPASAITAVRLLAVSRPARTRILAATHQRVLRNVGRERKSYRWVPPRNSSPRQVHLDQLVAPSALMNALLRRAGRIQSSSALNICSCLALERNNLHPVSEKRRTTITSA